MPCGAQGGARGDGAARADAAARGAGADGALEVRRGRARRNPGTSARRPAGGHRTTTCCPVGEDADDDDDAAGGGGGGAGAGEEWVGVKAGPGQRRSSVGAQWWRAATWGPVSLAAAAARMAEEMDPLPAPLAANRGRGCCCCCCYCYNGSLDISQLLWTKKNRGEKNGISCHSNQGEYNLCFFQQRERKRLYKAKKEGRYWSVSIRIEFTSAYIIYFI